MSAAHSTQAFLENLAQAFGVESHALAIVILVSICIGCLVFLILLCVCLRSCIRRSNVQKMPRRRFRSIYMDEIPGIDEKAGRYGQLHYTIEYDVQTSQLIVNIIEAQGLCINNESKLIDAYASLTVAMVQGEKFEQIGKLAKTPLKRRTDQPRWNHLVQYQIEEKHLEKTILLFEIFDFDAIGQDNSLGRLNVPLSHYDLGDLMGGPVEEVGWLLPGTQKYEGIGQICIGLSYNHALERIEAYVYEARDLQIQQFMSTMKNPLIFVRLELRHNGSSLDTFETTPKSELINPYFNEHIVFVLKSTQLADVSLRCELFKKGRWGRKETLGTSIIGPNSEFSTGSKHWNEMLEHSPRTHVMWHALTPSTYGDL